MTKALKNAAAPHKSIYFGGAKMQHFLVDSAKQMLESTIYSILDRRDEVLTSPDSDFTRTRKISFLQTILFPMLAGNKDNNDELLEFFGEKGLPRQSSMIERRNQVKPAAFITLFQDFSKCIPILKLFNGHQVVSADGTRLNLPFNPYDHETYIQAIKGRKGINQAHLNCLHDPLNDIFLDVELQSVNAMDEKGAFCRLLSRQKLAGGPTHKRIYVADRGYASYNIFAHAIHNGQLFLIRVPESFAKTMCTGKNREGWLEEAYCDEVITVNISRRNTKKNKQQPNFHYIPSSGHYDFIPEGADGTDSLRLRVVKFPIGEDTFEYIVTNLPQYSFSLSSIKELYHLRWSTETAFRHLKYAANMVHMHSRKREFLLQEIYAKLTLYNFSSFAAAIVGRTQNETEKYKYVLNFTKTISICIQYLKGVINDPESMIRKYKIPVRPGRRFPRNLRRQAADTLNYR